MMNVVRWLLGRRHARGGEVGPPATHLPALRIHHGEYIYTDAQGRTWHVQQHPDGNIRTRLDTQEGA